MGSGFSAIGASLKKNGGEKGYGKKSEGIRLSCVKERLGADRPGQVRVGLALAGL
jgi:hypothetical protein